MFCFEWCLPLVHDLIEWRNHGMGIVKPVTKKTYFALEWGNWSPARTLRSQPTSLSRGIKQLSAGAVLLKMQSSKHFFGPGRTGLSYLVPMILNLRDHISLQIIIWGSNSADLASQSKPFLAWSPFRMVLSSHAEAFPAMLQDPDRSQHWENPAWTKPQFAHKMLNVH